MIEIEEIGLQDINEFWRQHIRYLVEDAIITSEEDIAYFSSREYRDLLEAHMLREKDRHHALYFVENQERIGAAQYTCYQSEDGKCFILDFWIFPPFRGGGKGKACFHALKAYTKRDGAKYYMLNAGKERSVKFWKSLGFSDHGTDEWGMALYIRKST